ncbi:hypothetical protein SAMN05216327_10270 [Dyadobacter sp. SG02]|nr:hypothetical protein SAMN05216327_10270 [Dyadobacter sp. SG02]
MSFSNYPSGNLSTLTDTLDIQYLALENNQLLYTEVAKYLAEQNDSCQLFREGLGYIAISNIQLGRKGRPIPIDSIPNRLKEIEVVFDVGISSFYPHQNIGMPLYYAFVNNRLVLIYSQQSEWLHRNKYSFKSQRKIKDLIASTLTSLLSPNFVFRGLDGNTFRLTSDQRNDMSQEKVFELGSFTLNKSKTITQHFDGSVSYQYP